MIRFPKLRPRRAWVPAALAAVALAAACSDVLISLPEGPPDQMQFAIGGFEGPTARGIEVRGDTVVLRRRTITAAGEAIDSVRTVPTRQEWRDFWAAAQRAGVRRWARRYVDEDVVDGVGWGLRIMHDGWVLESDGSNAYPDRRGAEHDEMTDDFRAFVDALGELAGEPL